MTHIDYILKAVNESLKAEKVILFGSHAFGEGKKGSDLDIAVIQKDSPRLGQKARIFLQLSKLGYSWEKDPDVHIFSEDDFTKKLKDKDLFVTEISRGKVLYVKK